MITKLAVATALAILLAGAAEVRAQDRPDAGRREVGVLVGGFDYYFGNRSFYPQISGRIRQAFGEWFALEGSLTAVAAGEALACPDDGRCGGEAFAPLLYPAVGAQLRLPTGGISPYVGGSIGMLLESDVAASPSLELGLIGRLDGGRSVAIEVRRRFDDRFDLIETTATEVSVGLYWTVGDR